MKHRVAGRKLGRTSAHRLAVLRNLSTELFRRERIRTTLMKAKELRPFAEHLLTVSKRETLHARRLVLRDIRDKEVVAKMFDTLSSRYAQRPGGYTRIIKLGPRRGDASEMALIELVGAEIAAKPEPEEAAGKGAAKEAKETKPAKGKAAKKAKPPKEREEGAPKKGRGKAAAAPKTESKGKAKTSGTTRKVGKSGS
jgi:large subunit ribosomal protein L17